MYRFLLGGGGVSATGGVKIFAVLDKIVPRLGMAYSRYLSRVGHALGDNIKDDPLIPCVVPSSGCPLVLPHPI